ncbi:hypothetical protein BKA82DRAFT_1000432, partial [Pisolithus tinctorius]
MNEREEEIGAPGPILTRRRQYLLNWRTLLCRSRVNPTGQQTPSQSIRDERRRSTAAVTPHHTPTRGPGSTRRYSVASKATAPGGLASSQGSQSRGGYRRCDPPSRN